MYEISLAHPVTLVAVEEVLHQSLKRNLTVETWRQTSSQVSTDANWLTKSGVDL